MKIIGIILLSAVFIPMIAHVGIFTFIAALIVSAMIVLGVYLIVS